MTYFERVFFVTKFRLVQHKKFRHDGISWFFHAIFKNYIFLDQQGPSAVESNESKGAKTHTILNCVNFLILS